MHSTGEQHDDESAADRVRPRVALIPAHGSLAGAATTAHGETIEVRCTASGFITDANAFHGQRVEVTAFYRATGIVCRIFDGETGELLYDPSA